MRLKACPKCGAELELHRLYQRSYVYRISTKTGKISKTRKSVKGDYPMDSSFICCTKCDFHTDDDFKPSDLSGFCVKYIADKDYFEYRSRDA